MKFAGFFVEKVPIDGAGSTPGAASSGGPAHGGGQSAGVVPPQGHPGGGATHPAAPGQHPGQAQPMYDPAQGQVGAGTPGQVVPGQPYPGTTPALLQGHWNSPAGGMAPAQPRQVPLAIALRAWVPQEYAGYLTPFALHVIAAGGELTVEQARAYGAQAIVVSSECLGTQTSLLTSPQLPTVFIAPQPVSIPQRAGLVQVQEPLRASELASAVRDAVASWAGGITG